MTSSETTSSQWPSLTCVDCAVAIGNRVISEKPVAKHGEGVDIHPLVLSEALAHAEDSEEIPRHCPIQLGDGWWLTDACTHTMSKKKGDENVRIQLTWRDLGPVKNPPEEAPLPCVMLA